MPNLGRHLSGQGPVVSQAAPKGRWPLASKAASGSQGALWQAPVSQAEAARRRLAAARLALCEGRDAESLELLADWVGAVTEPQAAAGHVANAGAGGAAAAELERVEQAILALGCWLCNREATRLLQHAQVARAFSLTRTCERWLALRRGRSDEMWLRLRYDCALNAAELAQTSGDHLRASDRLRECEALQDHMHTPGETEAVHVCLAEVQLQLGRHEEAAASAQRAIVAQRRRRVVDERGRYVLLFALALEQSALAQLGDLSLPAPARALQCLPDAELACFVAPCAEPTPMDDATRALLAQMRGLHYELLLRRRQAATPDDETDEAESTPLHPEKPPDAAKPGGFAFGVGSARTLRSERDGETPMPAVEA